MQTMTYTDRVEAAIRRAQEIARETGESFAVIDIDGLDGRVVRVVREWYCDLDEFFAFDGKVLEIVDPS